VVRGRRSDRLSARAVGRASSEGDGPPAVRDP